MARGYPPRPGRGKQPGKGRLTVLLVVCLAVFALFVGRLAWMQFAQADYYAEKVAQANQTTYRVPIPAARGDIVDANGGILAADTTTYDLALCLPAPPGTDLAQTLDTLRMYNLIAPDGEDVETQLAAFFSVASAGELPLAEDLDATAASAARYGWLPAGCGNTLRVRCCPIPLAPPGRSRPSNGRPAITPCGKPVLQWMRQSAKAGWNLPMMHCCAGGTARCG